MSIWGAPLAHSRQTKAMIKLPRGFLFVELATMHFRSKLQYAAIAYLRSLVGRLLPLLLQQEFLVKHEPSTTATHRRRE
jgi:hypothetical protein